MNPNKPLTDPNLDLDDQHGLVIGAASDGACSGNPGPGGWGALIRFEDGTVKEFGGHEPATTNNRMELLGVLKILNVLKNLPYDPNLTIRTDSKYVINGLSTWIKGWKRNGWRTAAGKQVLNQDLWKLLDQAGATNIRLEYVKGHSGDPDNDRVDKIAVSYSKGADIKLNYETPTPFSSDQVKKTNAPAPKSLQRLLSRLDMANHLANNGYSLNMNELAELLDKPVSEIKNKKHSWQWRDWLVEPSGDSRWKLSHTKKNLFSSHKEQNG